MPKKEKLTYKNIEQDILFSLNERKELTEAEYNRFVIPVTVIGCLILVISFIKIKLAAVIWAALLVFVAIAAIASVLPRKKVKNVSIDDYEITTQVLADTTEESYRQKSRYRSRTVQNYTLRFENGKSWRIPTDNYIWSEEYRMSDFALYQRSHRGDTFIVVAKKDTGETVMAYSTALFELKREL